MIEAINKLINFTGYKIVKTKKTKVKRKRDATHLTKEIYEDIIREYKKNKELREAALKHQKHNYTNDKLVEKLNKKHNLSRSRRAYYYIWSGKYNKENLR